MFKDVLKNQVAVVTGGTSGIGKAIAASFVLSAAHVVILGTNEEKGKSAVAEIQALASKNPGSSIQFMKADVTSFKAVKYVIEDIIQQFGGLDILVNNAGITRDQLLLKMNEEDWDAVMDVNIKSCYFTVKSALRTMMKAKKGKILNIGSIVGLTGNAGQVNYSASKAAIIGLTKALAKELAPRNICVNCIAPGFIETAMTKELTSKQQEMILDKIPLKRMGQPEEVGHLATFLASPLSDYITGQVFVIDGGMII